MTGVGVGVGLWLGASAVLGRPAPVDEPYPHICGTTLASPGTRATVRLRARDCAACAALRDPRGGLP